MDSRELRLEQKRLYNKSHKGRAATARYRASDKGRTAKVRENAHAVERRRARGECTSCGKPRGASRGLTKCELCLDSWSIRHADIQIARYEEELREKSD